MSTDTQLSRPSKDTSIAWGKNGINITTLDEAFRFAQWVCKSGLAPDHFKEPAQVVIALQAGAEIGFSPMQSLQTIAVIGNRPCLWGDGLPALVMASGKCLKIREWLEGEGDELTAFCETQRVGQPLPKTAQFSVADAKRAKLWGKAGPRGPSPWITYPQRMLQMRARSWNFRDQFADVLKGIGVAEEVRDIPVMVVESSEAARFIEDADDRRPVKSKSQRMAESVRPQVEEPTGPINLRDRIAAADLEELKKLRLEVEVISEERLQAEYLTLLDQRFNQLDAESAIQRKADVDAKAAGLFPEKKTERQPGDE